MLTFVEKYAANTFSQNGEDGIIKECLKRIGVHYNKACEFGAADGFYCSNTAATDLPRVLIEVDKTMRYTKLYEEDVIIHEAVIPENVNDLVPQKLDLLSIDIDGNDENVWRAYKGIANIVVIEINSSIEPGDEFCVNDQKKGTDYISMLRRGIIKGYFLLCHTGNMIFVRKEFKKLFPEIEPDSIRNWPLFFRRDWIKEKAW